MAHVVVNVSTWLCEFSATCGVTGGDHGLFRVIYRTRLQHTDFHEGPCFCK